MVDANIGAPLSDTKFRWSKTSIECLVISQSHTFSQLVLGEAGKGKVKC